MRDRNICFYAEIRKNIYKLSLLLLIWGSGCNTTLQHIHEQTGVSYFLFFLFFMYRISSVIRRSFFLPKQSQRPRSILQDRSRSFGLFRTGKIGIIAKFHRTDLVIWSHSRGTKTPSYSRINTVILASRGSSIRTCYIFTGVWWP